MSDNFYVVRRKTGSGQNTRLMSLEQAQAEFESAKTEEGVYYAALCKSIYYGTAELIEEWDSSEGKERWQYNALHSAEYEGVAPELNVAYYLSRGNRVAFFRSCDELHYHDAYAEVQRSEDPEQDKRMANYILDQRIADAKEAE